MQVFGNIASPVQRKTTKAGKDYAEFRLAESQRSQPGSAAEEPTWFTVRVMKRDVPEFIKGDFVKVTGKLKADFYLSREGKPTGTLLIIAFEASKIAKTTLTQGGEKSGTIDALKEQAKEKVAPQHVRPSGRETEKAQAPAQEPQLATEQAHESDWSTLYS